METRKRIEALSENWDILFSKELVEANNKLRGVYATSNKRKLKKAFPELSTLLEQPAGTKLEVLATDYDQVQDEAFLPIPFLTLGRGYLVQLKAYYKDIETIEAGADLKNLELDVQRGANLVYQLSGFFHVIATPFISRKSNPNEFFVERDKLNEIEDPMDRYNQTFKILAPQILTVKSVDTGNVLYHNQTLEKQLEEFERRIKEKI